jgi:hypothetical protein
MLQAFYIDVAKVDRDVTHVAMTVHVCFKFMFHVFQTYVSSVMAIHVCFKCMFHVFQMYVSSVLSGCCKSRYGCCIYIHVKKCMFQVFHAYVASVSSRCCICFAMTTHVFSYIF